MQEAIDLAVENVRSGRGGPFGCVIEKDGRVIGRGTNVVTSTHDPTAHAEIQAIREACAHLGDFQLNGCRVYTSCEPCPMCLGALYWARPAAVYFAATREEAAAAGFDDELIYRELEREATDRRMPMHRLDLSEAGKPFDAWRAAPERVEY